MIANADNLPSVSIVIPNFNGGDFLGEAIESVLDQSYPHLELLVIDGGSRDHSVDIIKRFAPHLAYWESQPDEGQSHAINKGLMRSRGEIVNWLCSDDHLTPGALRRVGGIFAEMPEVDVVAGKSRWEFEDGSPSRLLGPSMFDIRRLPFINPIQQPSCFYRRRLLRPVPLRQELHYTMDVELWAYLNSRGVHWHLVDDVLSVYRITGENKSSVGGLKSWQEWKQIFAEYAPLRARLSVPVAEHVRGPIRHYAQHHANSLASLPLRWTDRVVAKATKTLCGRAAEDIANTFYWMYCQHRSMS